VGAKVTVKVPPVVGFHGLAVTLNAEASAPPLFQLMFPVKFNPETVMV
jgi:hypothetical protein